MIMFCNMRAEEKDSDDHTCKMSEWLQSQSAEIEALVCVHYFLLSEIQQIGTQICALIAACNMSTTQGED